MTPAAFAVFVGGLLIIVTTALIYAVSRALSRPAAGRHAFADPADVTDPAGSHYVAALADDRPSGIIHFNGTLDAATLARIRDKIAALPARPRLDDTQPIPHAVGTWGMPATALADQLARRYLEVTR